MGKITDQDLEDCLAKKMEMYEIAEAFDLQPYTVILRIQKLKKQERDKEGKKAPMPFNGKAERDPPQVVRFDLRVGDIVWALEEEVSKFPKEYKVIGMTEHLYICKRNAQNGWTTAFRKADYKRRHDAGKVSLKSRGDFYDKAKKK